MNLPACVEIEQLVVLENKGEIHRAGHVIGGHGRNDKVSPARLRGFLHVADECGNGGGLQKHHDHSRHNQIIYRVGALEAGLLIEITYFCVDARYVFSIGDLLQKFDIALVDVQASTVKPWSARNKLLRPRPQPTSKAWPPVS